MIALAIRIASAGERQLVLLDLNHAREKKPWVDSAIELASAAEVEATVESSQELDAKRAIELSAADLSAELIFVGRAGLNPRQERACDALFANPPVEIAMLWGQPGDKEDRPRVLAAGPDAAKVVDLASALAGEVGSVTLLALERSEFEIALRLSQPLNLRSPVRFRRQTAQSRETALLAAQREGSVDIIVMDATRHGPSEWLARGTDGAVVGSRAGVPVVAVARPLPPPLRMLLGALGAFSGLLPDLSEQDRISVYVALRRAARGGVDFRTMVILSTAIAALGLLMDSAVIIVGAMLVAPLMTPIMAGGLGVAQGDGRLVRMAVSTVVLGAASAAIVGGAVGLVHPHEGVTDQMVARTQPSVSDLLVAIASGAAGAYATCRTQVASSLAGVGIAVSLVPPLAVVGLGSGLGNIEIATGAALLFLVNLFAIAATASGMFFWLGFRPKSGPANRIAVFVRGVGSLTGVVALVLVAVLVWQDAAISRDRLEIERAAAAAVSSVDDDATVERFEIVSRSDRLIIVDVDVRGRDIDGEDAGRVQSAIARKLETPVELTLRVMPVFFAGEGLGDCSASEAQCEAPRID